MLTPEQLPLVWCDWCMMEVDPIEKDGKLICPECGGILEDEDADAKPAE